MPREIDSRDGEERATGRDGGRRRTVTPAQWERFTGYLAEILDAFGLDLDTPGTAATPRRFLQALFDATEGYDGDPKLLTTFPNEISDAHAAHNQVVEGPIPFFALCEHHVFPFFGHAYVGYVAAEQLVGISKLTRLVRLFARRFTLQERLGNQVADLLCSMIQPHGVAVYVEAQHLCIQMRGVRDLQPKTHTVVWRGVYNHQPDLRREFLDLIGRGRQHPMLGRARTTSGASARRRSVRTRVLRPTSV